MESLTTLAMQQHQQQDDDEEDDDDDDDDDVRTLDRLASFAAISEAGVASRRRLLQRRHLANARRLSVPDTVRDIRTADSYVVALSAMFCHSYSNDRACGTIATLTDHCCLASLTVRSVYVLSSTCKSKVKVKLGYIIVRSKA